MRRALSAGAVLAALAAAPAPAPARPAHVSIPRARAHVARAVPSVEMMIVGRTRTLLSARTVRLGAARVTVGRRRCTVAAGTAIAGLAAARLPLRLTDAGGCDPASLFVVRVGTDANRGQAGWEYKVDHVAPSLGAGDPGGRLGTSQRLLWFWCTSANSCQRTLDVVPSTRTVAPGASLPVHVRGYDSNGNGQRVRGVTVQMGSGTALTGADGSATVRAPSAAGVYELAARKPGLVPSFPLRVRVS